MTRRASTLSERLAGIERDVTDAAKAYKDAVLANDARVLRRVIRTLNTAAIELRSVAEHPALSEQSALPEIILANAATLSSARRKEQHGG